VSYQRKRIVSGLLTQTRHRKRHRATKLYREIEEKARREDALAVLVLEDGDGRRFVVAPYEAGYFEVLLDELRKAAGIAEANRHAVPVEEGTHD
jgi:hypothetical protein